MHNEILEKLTYLDNKQGLDTFEFSYSVVYIKSVNLDRITILLHTTKEKLE